MLIDRSSPLEGESLSGYFLRLAEDNGLRGVAHLLSAAAVKPRTSYTEDQLKRIAGIIEIDPALLFPINPRPSATTPSLNPHFMPGTRAACCPLCLKAARVMRREWSSSLCPACTHHRCLLTDCCPECAVPLTWHRSSVVNCDCGADLSMCAPKAAQPITLAISCLLTGTPLSDDLASLLPHKLATERPEGLDELLWFFICHASAPSAAKPMKRPRPSSTDEAVHELEANFAPTLTGWPDGLHSLMDRIGRGSSKDSAGTGLYLGRWYRELFRRFGQGRYQWLHDEVAGYVARHMAVSVNDRTTRVPRSLTSIKGWLSVAETSKVLHVAPERLRTALRWGMVEGEVRTAGPDRDLCFIRREQVEALRIQRATYADARAAMSILGVTRRQLDRLIQCGAVTRYEDSQRPPMVDHPFRRDELDGLLSRIEHRAVGREINSDRQLKFGDIAAVRGRGETYVLNAYRAIADGEVVPRSIDACQTGLSRFVFDADEIEHAATGHAHAHMLTLSQVCEMTGWKPEAVSRWVDADLLAAQRVPNGASRTTLIDVRALVAFLRTYVVVADEARSSGTRPRYLNDRLRASGCPIFQVANSSGIGFGSLVRIQDLCAAISQESGND